MPCIGFYLVSECVCGLCSVCYRISVAILDTNSHFPKSKLCVIFSFLSCSRVFPLPLRLILWSLFHLLALITIARRRRQWHATMKKMEYTHDINALVVRTHSTHTQSASDSQKFMRSKSIESIKFAGVSHSHSISRTWTSSTIANSSRHCRCVCVRLAVWLSLVCLFETLFYDFMSARDYYYCYDIVMPRDKRRPCREHNSRKYVNRKW